MGLCDFGSSHAAVREAFAAAFGPGQPISIGPIAQAIAAYERTLITPDAPYDRFVRGDASALTQQQLRGMALFESVGCVGCHTSPSFSRASILTPEKGHAGMRLFPVWPNELTAKLMLDVDRGAASTGSVGLWRVPSLRNVELTAPYFHNGSVPDLTEAVRLMAETELARVVQDAVPADTVIGWDAAQHRITRYTPLTISQADIADIVAFLRSLTSNRLRTATAAPR